MSLKDVKEALSSARKPDITHVRSAFLTYTARPCEYGCDKYERANFMRPTGDGPHTVPTGEDFGRFRAYLRAAMGHIASVLDSMERHQSQDPNLVHTGGMIEAAYAVDTDAKPGQKIGASLLPHVAPACSSLMMAIQQAVDCGLLPADPGTPWRDARPAQMELPLDTRDAAIVRAIERVKCPCSPSCRETMPAVPAKMYEAPSSELQADAPMVQAKRNVVEELRRAAEIANGRCGFADYPACYPLMISPSLQGVEAALDKMIARGSPVKPSDTTTTVVEWQQGGIERTHVETGEVDTEHPPIGGFVAGRVRDDGVDW